jgi:putative phosphoesterase
MVLSMKLLILSDTHGNYPLALKATEIAGTYDGIIHLGDGMEDAGMIADITGSPVVTIAGNCDAATSAPREYSRIYAGKKLFCTHGDSYNVKAGLAKLHKKALAEEARIVLYGHTHRAAIESFDGVLFINPGSLHKSASIRSFATLSIAADDISAEIVVIDQDLHR